MDLSDLSKTLLCKKPVFLSNPSNKQQFVNALADALQSAGYDVSHSPADADRDIVMRAMEDVVEKDTILVGDDTDLLVMVLHYFKTMDTQHRLLMYRPSSKTLIDILKLINKLPDHILNNIIPLHALSGCDTVSSLAGVGKTKLIKMVLKDPSLADHLHKFLDSNFNDDTETSAKQLITKLYCPTKSVQYDDLRLW